jgi:ribosomal protein S18 acetylase RimI-like enzyme
MGLTCDDGQCQTVGTLDRHIVRDYVEKRYVDMVKCYERHAKNLPRVELTLHFEIGRDGTPNEVYAEGEAAAFGSCLVRLVERVKFPADRPTQVRAYPVAFWRTKNARRVLRAARPDEREWFFTSRRDGFRVYAEQEFGPWDDTKQRASANKDFDELPIEIVERDGEPIGYQIILGHDDHLFLDEIVVVAAARNAGIGAGLVKDVMAAARAAGLPVRLSVLACNPAQRLYELLGFRVSRREPPRVKMEWP